MLVPSSEYANASSRSTASDMPVRRESGDEASVVTPMR
jgi:hypothetical protein